jgi:hypothetical protein
MQSWTGLEGRLLIKSSLAFVLSRSINKAGNYNGLGLNLNLNLGYVLNRSGIGIDIQYNPFLSTHIKHSEYWREYYYANAKDGWYSSTANNLRIGAFHCQKLDNQKTWEINLRGGYQTSGKFDHLIPGFYFIIGINKTV